MNHIKNTYHLVISGLKKIKKIKNNYERGMYSILCIVITCFYSLTSFADDSGFIPISSDDKVLQSESFTTTLERIFARDIIPFIEIGGAIVIATVALITLIGGINKSREIHDSQPVKTALTHIALLVVVGGSILFLLSYIAGKIGQ